MNTEPPVSQTNARQGQTDGRPAVFVRPAGVRKRPDFLKAARAQRQGTAGIMVQARKRHDGEAGTGIRVGFTCSKKVGNSVTRNRAKRRLRAIAELVLPEAGRDGWDYVLIGRAEATVNRPFDALQSDLRYALRKIHGAS